MHWPAAGYLPNSLILGFLAKLQSHLQSNRGDGEAGDLLSIQKPDAAQPWLLALETQLGQQQF